MTDFRREVRFEKGYDYTVEDASKPPGQGRGVHGLNIRWLLHGDEGTVQFLVYTQWLPSWVEEDETFGPRVGRERGHVDGLFSRPMAADLGFHWDRPWYEGQDGERECDVRPNGRCFYDGSGLRAENVLALLLTEGGEAVWQRMEAEYAELASEATQVAS